MNKNVKIAFLDQQSNIPLLLQALNKEIDILKWVEDNLDYIKSKLTEHGALLLRNFNIADIKQLKQVVELIIGQLENNIDRNATRSAVNGNILTSTDAPSNMNILLHCESAFAHRWPSYIFFYCNIPPTSNGETPICDMNKVFNALPKDLVDVFLEKKIMYVRNFGPKKLNWKYVFQVENKEELQRYCINSNIIIDWIDKENFIAKQIRPAILEHPITGLTSWFNQIHIFRYRKSIFDKLNPLYSKFKPSRNALFGDKKEIPQKMIDIINKSYLQEKIMFKWQKDDLLILDNLKVGHGRNPYGGERSIWTGMSNFKSWE